MNGPDFARLDAEDPLAALHERQRLAQNLHDAVNQSLFSAGLIAEVLPRLWQRNPEEAQRRLEELRQLTKGALSEMRTLLLELRPAVEERRVKELKGTAQEMVGQLVRILRDEARVIE